MFSKIPKQIHYTEPTEWKPIEESEIKVGRVGCTSQTRCPNTLPFVIVNVTKNGDKVTCFDMIFPRIQEESVPPSDNLVIPPWRSPHRQSMAIIDLLGGIQEEPASGLIFGQDQSVKEKVKYCQCTCPPHPMMFVDCSCGADKNNLKAYESTFKRASEDQEYPVYRMDYQSWIASDHMHEDLVWEIADDLPMRGTPESPYIVRL